MVTETAAAPTNYPDLPAYLQLAAQVLNVPEETARRHCRLDLADAALTAPAAFHRDVELYPRLPQKAAVLGARLTRCGALVRGNLTVGFRCMCLFLELNNVPLEFPRGERPDDVWQLEIMTTFRLMERVEHASATDDELESWVLSHLGTRRR